MIQFNAELKFPGNSGTIRSLQNSLTLAGSPSGETIIPNDIRPNINNQHQLGQDHLRWKTLFSCSGNFLERPTVNGSGVLLQGESAAEGAPDAGQTSIEGISGVVDLNSPDKTININVNGQTIELTTPTSGAPSGVSYILVDYNDNDHLTDARKLSATSGIRIKDDGARSNSGIALTLDFDDEPTVGDSLTWEGTKLQWTAGAAAGVSSIEGLVGVVDLDSPDASINIAVNGQVIELTVPGGAGVGSAEKTFSPSSGTIFVVEHGLDTTAFVWSMWQTHADEADLDPILSLIPTTVSPSGANHAIINIKEAVSGVVTFVG